MKNLIKYFSITIIVCVTFFVLSFNIVKDNALPSFSVNEKPNLNFSQNEKPKLDYLINSDGSSHLKINELEPLVNKEFAEKTIINTNNIEAFNRWSREFLSGKVGELEGLNLAKARRVEMAKLIRDNPSLAISKRVPQDIRDVLPESIRGELEQQVHGRGRFDALSISRLDKSSHMSDVAAQYHGLDPRLAKRGDETRLVQSTIQELTHNGRV